MRRRGGRHGRWRLVGRRRGRRVSRGTAPHVSFLEARAIKSSSSSLARRRNAPASRPGSSSAISPTCATWRPRALAAGVGQRPPWRQHTGLFRRPFNGIISFSRTAIGCRFACVSLLMMALATPRAARFARTPGLRPLAVRAPGAINKYFTLLLYCKLILRLCFASPRAAACQTKVCFLQTNTIAS